MGVPFFARRLYDIKSPNAKRFPKHKSLNANLFG